MDHDRLFWNPDTTPSALHPLLDCLSEEYPISREGGGRRLEFSPTSDPCALRVSTAGDVTTIGYGSESAAARGIGHALAGQSVGDARGFQTMGIMLDCSRHAVMTVPYLKRWMRRLSLMGYNMLMLYTEDTYQIPGEPYFGYMRGGYSGKEIQEIDAYARRLGIEVVACIQTLGHLEQILKWPRFKEVCDTERVLLADEPKSYELIEKMIRFWAENLGSRRIHVGMDEAHDMGRGRFLDQHGRIEPFEVFNRHLSRVESICTSHGLRPMIWSDMYFRMGNPNHDYYDRNTVIPDAVKAAVPKEVDLVYWDYYTSDQTFYAEWIERHRDLGRGPVMASGIWTWVRYWYDHSRTEAAVRPCVAACRNANLDEIIFTIWGDGNSYCEFDSAFAGMAFAADLCYGGDGLEDSVGPFVRAIHAGDYSAMLMGTELQTLAGPDKPELTASTILWDDPLLGIGWQGYLHAGPEFWPDVLERLRSLRDRTTPLKEYPGPPDFEYLWLLCDVMARKVHFREELVAAYRVKDLSRLRALKDHDIPDLLAALADLEKAFRRQWLRRNKPFGMEATQIRLGAGSTRYREAALRIGEFCNGDISSIEELEAQPEGLGPNPVSYFAWLATGGLNV